MNERVDRDRRSRAHNVTDRIPNNTKEYRAAARARLNPTRSKSAAKSYKNDDQK